MNIELGNKLPHDGTEDKPLPGPCVTYIFQPDDRTLEPGADVTSLAIHLAQHPDVTQLPDHEAFVEIVHGSEGVWGHGGHGSGNPTWVHCESVAFPEKAAELQRLLSEYYRCSSGRPEDVEDTHYTRSGPPTQPLELSDPA